MWRRRYPPMPAPSWAPCPSPVSVPRNDTSLCAVECSKRRQRRQHCCHAHWPQRLASWRRRCDDATLTQYYTNPSWYLSDHHTPQSELHALCCSLLLVTLCVNVCSCVCVWVCMLLLPLSLLLLLSLPLSSFLARRPRRLSQSKQKPKLLLSLVQYGFISITIRK